MKKINLNKKVNLLKKSDKSFKHTISLVKSTDKKVNINKPCITYWPEKHEEKEIIKQYGYAVLETLKQCQQ